MPPPSDAARVRHMLDAAQAALRYTAGRTRETFVADPILVAAVAHWVSVIGEAARLISPETRALAPGTPWPQIVGTRHILAHEYFRIDPARLWDIVTEDLIPLVGALEALIAVIDAPPASATE